MNQRWKDIKIFFIKFVIQHFPPTEGGVKNAQYTLPVPLWYSFSTSDPESAQTSTSILRLMRFIWRNSYPRARSTEGRSVYKIELKFSMHFRCGEIGLKHFRRLSQHYSHHHHLHRTTLEVLWIFRTVAAAVRIQNYNPTTVDTHKSSGVRNWVANRW